MSDHSTDDWLVAVTVRRHTEADRHYRRKSGTVSMSSTGQRTSTYAWLDGGSILVTASAPARRLGVSHMTLLDKGVGPWVDLPDEQFVHVTYEYRRWALFAGGDIAVTVIDGEQLARLGAVPARRTRGWMYPSARRSYGSPT